MVPVATGIADYSYCPRQCALIHVEQTFDENVFTIRGRLAHELVHEGEDTTMDGVRIARAMPVWSERHRMRGKADLVEFRREGPFPVEFKVGRRQGEHPDLQLCAQALCLEEMLGVPVPQGAVFYHATRKRFPVSFDAHLRARTLTAVEAIRAMLRTQALPEAPNDARCPNCSLVHCCMPSVVAESARLRGLQGALFHAWNVGDHDA
jgi:CRISPR-associated exonuclease Cas4